MVINADLFSTIFGQISLYGLVYIIGFLCFLLFPERLLPDYPNNHTVKTRLQPQEQFLLNLYNRFYLAVFINLFGIIGGRLGYVFIYDWPFYRENLDQIFALNLGGMSYHGGVLAILICILLTPKIRCLKILDLCALCALIVVPLGRIANFFNGELIGTITNVPWAFIFSTADLLPRHPVQLYEAICEGPLLAMLVYFANKKSIKSTKKAFPFLKKRSLAGTISSFYIIIYSIIRFFLEFFREPDPQLGYVLFDCISMGQILCILFFLLGLFWYWAVYNQQRKVLKELTYNTEENITAKANT